MRCTKALLPGVALGLVLTMFFGTRSLAAQVTPPEDYLGFKPGADFHLMNYEEAIGYFEEMLKFWGKPQVETREIKDARERLAKLRS